MPGTVQQELTRIIQNMRAKGVKTAWLSEANIKAMSAKPGLPYTQPAPVRTQIPPQVPQSVQQVPQAPVQAPPQQAPAQAPVQVPPQAPVQAPIQAPVISRQQNAPVPVDAQIPAGWAEQIKSSSWEGMEELCRNCRICPMSSSCHHKLFHAGQKRAKVMFVGDFPTAEEDASGVPFSGLAGQMLFKMGRAMGLQWEDCQPNQALGYANVLKCRPASLPTQAQISACLPFLHRQIELTKPEVIVLLGQLPTKTLTGKTGFSQLKGKLQTYIGIPAMPIQHPAIIMRYANQQQDFTRERKEAWTALQEVMKLLPNNN